MDDGVSNVLNMEASSEHPCMHVCTRTHIHLLAHSLPQPNIHPGQTHGCIW